MDIGKGIAIILMIIAALLPANSQLVLKAEIGFSKLHPYNFDRPRLKTTNYIRAYRLGLLKYFGQKCTKYEVGATLNFFGAKEAILVPNWRLTYLGIPLGVSHKIDKVTFGLRTSPSFQIATNFRLGFDGIVTYNFDIEPNIKLNVAEGIDLTGSFSYGLNPSIPFGREFFYSLRAILFGIDIKLHSP